MFRGDDNVADVCVWTLPTIRAGATGEDGELNEADDRAPSSATRKTPFSSSSR